MAETVNQQTIALTIKDMKTNTTKAYQAVEGKGGFLTDGKKKNLINLEEAIRSIPQGSTAEKLTVDLNFNPNNDGNILENVTYQEDGKSYSPVVINKPSTLIAENIRAQKTIAGVPGSFTSDATASEKDILSGKMAYAQGEAVTGTYVVNSVEFKGDQLTFTDSLDSKYTIIPDAATDAMSSVAISKPTNLTAKNIACKKTIAGIAGSYDEVEASKAATSKTVMSGYKAFVNGDPVEGSLVIDQSLNVSLNFVADNVVQDSQTVSPTNPVKEVVISRPETLIAENIKDGVAIAGIGGSFTRDAELTVDNTNYTSSQMLAGATAYAQGNKYTGTIKNYGGKWSSASLNPPLTVLSEDGVKKKLTFKSKSLLDLTTKEKEYVVYDTHDNTTSEIARVPVSNPSLDISNLTTGTHKFQASVVSLDGKESAKGNSVVYSNSPKLNTPVLALAQSEENTIIVRNIDARTESAILIIYDDQGGQEEVALR